MPIVATGTACTEGTSRPMPARSAVPTVPPANTATASGRVRAGASGTCPILPQR